MSMIFGFGEKVEGYDVPVLNEREARAAAGLLFVAAFFAFMNVWLIGNYFYIKLFVSGFLVDFAIRLFINPRYAPSLVVGRWIVRKQKVEYTGAPQKRFAWTIGFLMSSFMFYSLVLSNRTDLATCVLCLVCLTFLFFETAFGICIGCWLYNLTHKQKAHFCPGGVCEIHQPEPIQRVTILQIGLVILFGLSLWWWSRSPWLKLNQSSVTGQDCFINKVTGQPTNNANSCVLVAP